ncbi:hypothetical protein BASA81_000543 [Batrachochytrium salamandrivorans]|nr:hypothetical protein BASA81_000543 [Batrachochytrium salamandrivorans]
MGKAWKPKLTVALHKAGPLFQKFAHWAVLATMHPQLPDMQFVLTQDEVFLQEPLEHTLTTLNESGIHLESFNPVPLGVGCVAQVHEAVLKHTHVKVAVKVLKRNIHSQLEQDLPVLQTLSWWGQWLLPQLPIDLVETTSEFCHHLQQQCNLFNEYHNLTQLQQQQPKRKRNQRPIQIVFPSPLLATTHVLVETLHSTSIPLSAFIQSAPQAVRTDIANALVRGFFEMCLSNNLAHADLHEGNILVTTNRDGKVKELVLLDAGLVSQLPPQDKVKLTALLDCILLKGDVEAATNLFLHDFASITNGKGLATKVKLVMDQESERVMDTQSDVDVARVSQHLYQLMQDHHVTIHAPSFVPLFLAFSVVNGTIQRHLDSNWNVCSYTYLLLDIL